DCRGGGGQFDLVEAREAIRYEVRKALRAVRFQKHGVGRPLILKGFLIRRRTRAVPEFMPGPFNARAFLRGRLLNSASRLGTLNWQKQKCRSSGFCLQVRTEVQLASCHCSLTGRSRSVAKGNYRSRFQNQITASRGDSGCLR